ncbi:MAG: hypothetical protein PHX07_02225 [Candidatus Marinimicrobia bacterium]|jgi:tetratricopeptide (TPR) repeat protein|nr:hypothetical protein [Candidatus Neomarinimicrobiota bacterium]MDD4961033.1 hypothetical protein [Candidatus Neomarinimicrobiota bacterium]MDD5709131.1 hypothetical protein [Candidatus Neomarinimicrobiota bacterium]MDX9777565.1 hypothetical protein [bacterium]
MKRIFVSILFVLSFSGLLLRAESEPFEEVFDHFYNYRFKEARDYLTGKIISLNEAFPCIAFLSYANIRIDLLNARYAGILERSDSMIALYRPVYEKHLNLYPDNVDVQFYYTVLLAGKMRIYLNKMDYIQIIKDGPRILERKLIIDRYSQEPFYDMFFGTGSFQYYLSVVGRNIGLGNMMNQSMDDGIADLENAYRNGKFTKWEAAIALMYVYLYDKMDYTACDELCNTFLKKYPDNLEVRAIAAECSYSMNHFIEGDRHIRHIQRLLDNGILENDIGMRARVLYLKGIRAMLKKEHFNALDFFNQAHELDNIEYSWYKAIILKYIGDVYLEMGLTRTAILYYEETVNSSEIIPHVREAKEQLKKLKK